MWTERSPWRRRAPVWLAIALLHGGATLLLNSGRTPVPRETPQRLTVRLIAAERRTEAAPVHAPTPRLPAITSATPQAPSPPDAMPGPTDPVTPGASAWPPAGAPVAGPDPAEPRQSRLVLTLPPGAASAPRNPALGDPRANTPRPTLEARIASAVGSAVLVEERLDSQRMTLRQGGGCVLVERSRLESIDPFNLSAKPIPRGVGRC